MKGNFLMILSLLDLFADNAIDRFLGNVEHTQPNFCHYLSAGDQCHTTLNFADLPVKKSGTMRLIVVSDTHERHTKLHSFPAGDIFIHCGDILMTSRVLSVKAGIRKLYWFNEWMKDIPCKHKLIIAGNHDGIMEMIGKEAVQKILSNAVYLENSLIEIDQIKVWGTPYSSGKSINKAFQSDKFSTETVQNAPTSGVDILITHGQCPDLEEKVPHSVHLWGHSHSSYGIRMPPTILKGKPVLNLSICVPIMDKHFRPTHLPVVLDISAVSKDFQQFSSNTVSGEGGDLEMLASNKIKEKVSSTPYRKSLLARFTSFISASESPEGIVRQSQHKISITSKPS